MHKFKEDNNCCSSLWIRFIAEHVSLRLVIAISLDTGRIKVYTFTTLMVHDHKSITYLIMPSVLLMDCFTYDTCLFSLKQCKNSAEGCSHMRKCLASIPFSEVFSGGQPCQCGVWCSRDISVFIMRGWSYECYVHMLYLYPELTSVLSKCWLCGEPVGWSSGFMLLVIGPLLWYFLFSHLFYYVHGQVPGMA